MKSTYLFAFLVLFTFKSVHAQQEKNQVAISIGAASSLAGTAINLSGGENTSTSPAMNINADLGMNHKFSLGVSYCYQNFVTNGIAYVQGSSTPYGYNYYSVNFKATQNRHNAGVRFLFHFTEKKDVDLYAGLRLSYLFNDTQSDLDPNLVILDKSNYSIGVIGGTKNRYTQQLVLGGKYYWNESFGVF